MMLFHERTVANSNEYDNGEYSFDNQKLKDAAAFIRKRVAKSQKGPFSEIVTITPEMAVQMLLANPENRVEKPSHVATLVKDMINGKFNGLNGQSIVVASNGELNDGQHRLTAVMRSGIAIDMNIFFGASRESRMTIDQNKPRTAGDFNAMSGLKDANHKAAVSNALLRLESGVKTYTHRSLAVSSSSRPTKVEVNEYSIKHDFLLTDAITSVRHSAYERPCPISQLATAFIWIHWAGNNWEDVEAFMIPLCTGERLTRTMPAYQARRRLAHEKEQGMSGLGVSLEVIFRAWASYVKNKKVTSIQVRRVIPEVAVMK